MAQFLHFVPISLLRNRTETTKAEKISCFKFSGIFENAENSWQRSYNTDFRFAIFSSVIRCVASPSQPVNNKKSLSFTGFGTKTIAYYAPVHTVEHPLPGNSLS